MSNCVSENHGGLTSSSNDFDILTILTYLINIRDVVRAVSEFEAP